VVPISAVVVVVRDATRDTGDDEHAAPYTAHMISGTASRAAHEEPPRRSSRDTGADLPIDSALWRAGQRLALLHAKLLEMCGITLWTTTKDFTDFVRNIGTPHYLVGQESSRRALLWPQRDTRGSPGPEAGTRNQPCVAT
jgi:hypothetical protein